MAIPEKVTRWLLEADNPPVRHLTLTGLLRKPPGSREVRESRSALMQYEVTQGILRHAADFSKGDEGAYSKYTGKYWQIIFLGQFLADGKDPRIAKCLDGILENSLWVSKAGGQCLTANLLAASMRLGRAAHPVVRAETEALAQRVLAERGITCRAMDYSLLPGCHMARPKLLLCFGQVPREKRSRAMAGAIDLLVEGLLENEVHIYVPGDRGKWQEVLAQLPKDAKGRGGRTVKELIREEREKLIAAGGLGPRQPKQGWLKFAFPLHYNSDVLEAMYALSMISIPMKRELEEPLRAIKRKMTAEGRWILESSLNGKMLVDVEGKGKPSKWLTCFAWHVLEHFGSRG